MTRWVESECYARLDLGIRLSVEGSPVRLGCGEPTGDRIEPSGNGIQRRPLHARRLGCECAVAAVRRPTARWDGMPVLGGSMHNDERTARQVDRRTAPSNP
jgi:hypothetical protein